MYVLKYKLIAKGILFTHIFTVGIKTYAHIKATNATKPATATIDQNFFLSNNNNFFISTNINKNKAIQLYTIFTEKINANKIINNMNPFFVNELYVSLL